MKAEHVRGVCAAAPIGLLVVLWLVYQPLGTWGQVFIFTSLIAISGILALFYGGPASRIFGGAIGIIFMLASIGIAVRGSFNEEAFRHLSEYITPYDSNLEYIEEKSNHPSLHSGQIIWVIKTSDALSKVRNFYLNDSNLDHWELTAEQPIIVLEEEGGLLTIKLESSSGTTRIIYDYKTVALED